MTPPRGRPAGRAVRDAGDERHLLFKAALAVMRRSGYANANISDILAEAQLGTRAFYRHFQSKDELLVALYQENAEITRRRFEQRMATAGAQLEQVLAWVDEMLDLGYDPRRGGRARIFTSQAARAAFGSAGYGATAELYAPLEQVLIEGAAAGAFPTCDPGQDAASIHAIAWRFVWPAIHGRPVLERGAARSHVLRFALPALGVPPP